MEIEGEHLLAASPVAVWDSLNDPDVLQACIPGCESLERDGDDRFTCVVLARYGPVKARFNAQLSIEDSDPPNAYTLQGEGKGGAAGFGKGTAHVTLAAQGEETLLTYRAQFTVGGKLAQIGSRLTASTTRKLSDEFFNRFAERFVT